MMHMLRKMPATMRMAGRLGQRNFSDAQAIGAQAEAYVAMFESLSPTWVKHAELISSLSSTKDDISVLDIGAGPGEPSCTVAGRLPLAKITCTDVSEAMTTKAKERAESKGVQLAAFGITGAEDLSQYADASFDFITMSQVLQFVPARDKCLDECVRVLKPGGKVLSTVWKTNPFVDAIGVAMEKFTGQLPGAPPPAGPLALQGANAQEDLAKAAGLEVIHTEEFPVDIVCKDEMIYRAVSMMVMGPKLKAMEDEGRAGATQKFCDIFVAIGDAGSVPGLAKDSEGGYAFVNLCQMVVMGKAP